MHETRHEKEQTGDSHMEPNQLVHGPWHVPLHLHLNMWAALCNEPRPAVVVVLGNHSGLFPFCFAV